MIDKELLAILACPDTHQGLQQAPEELLGRINARIARGEQRNVGGALVTEPLESGLVREDQKILYPVREEIPVLLVEEGLPV